MTPPTTLSTLAQRMGPPAISDLMSRALANPNLISLAAGFVDAATLPASAVAEAIEAVLREPSMARNALQYGSTRGDGELRALLAERIRNEVPERSVSHFDDLEDRLVVTTGSQQLLYLVAEALLDPGDIVLVESPTYFVFLGLLRGRGARVIGVACDEDGLRIDALEQTLADLEAEGQLDRVKMIYSVVEHSNPTGLSLSESRRAELIALAERWSKSQRIYVFEDAAYRGLSFEEISTPSLLHLDPTNEVVIHARTFSKTFSPGMKVGYGALPESLLQPVLNLKGNHDFGTSHFHQRLLVRIVSDGSYDAQVALLRERYRTKRDVVLKALGEYLGPLDSTIHWTEPAGGIYVWLSLPEDLDTGPEGPLFDRAIEQGVLYVPGRYAFADEPNAAPTHQIRFSFGVPELDALAEGTRRLGSAVERSLEAIRQPRSVALSGSTRGA